MTRIFRGHQGRAPQVLSETPYYVCSDLGHLESGLISRDATFLERWKDSVRPRWDGLSTLPDPTETTFCDFDDGEFSRHSQRALPLLRGAFQALPAFYDCTFDVHFVAPAG